jgi:hypothetical protein
MFTIQLLVSLQSASSGPQDFALSRDFSVPTQYALGVRFGQLVPGTELTGSELPSGQIAQAG